MCGWIPTQPIRLWSFFDAIPTKLPAFIFEHWPTDDWTITQPFGANASYYSQFGLPGHEGIDIRAPLNTPIYAVQTGVVHAVYEEGAYGQQVRLKHQKHHGGYQTIYAHGVSGSAKVALGETVKSGQIIMLANNTGNSRGSHLHLTLKHAGATAAGRTPYPSDIIDPTPFLTQLMSSDVLKTGALGIDINYYIDMGLALAAGVKFVIIKVTEGTHLTKDHFNTNRIEAERYGIQWATYHYLRPEQDGAAQASYYLSKFDRYNDLLVAGERFPRLWLDVEASPYSPDPTMLQDPNKVLAFLERCEQITGLLPGIYTRATYWDTLNPSRLDPRFLVYPLWIAHYNKTVVRPSVSDPWKKANKRELIHQYSKVGRLPKINRDVDLNVLTNGTDVAIPNQ